LRAGRALNGLRRLSKCAEKRSPHTLAIAETGLAGDDFYWMPPGLHHHARGFHSQVLDRFGR
jgi:hypothetical protein